MSNETQFINGVQYYWCRGQSYAIPESLCNERQNRNYRQCRKCSLRIGGLNDPRLLVKESV